MTIPDTGKITIDDKRLLDKTVRGFIEKERELTGLPRELETSRIPSKSVIRPSKITPDPLRSNNLFSHTKANFDFPSSLSPNIFNLNVTPSIGDKEKIQNNLQRVKEVKGNKKEKEIISKMLNTLETVEKDLQFANRERRRYVLG